MNILFSHLVKSKVWVASAVAALSWASELALLSSTRRPSFRLLLIVFGATLAIYNLDALLDERDHPHPGPTERARKAAVLGGFTCASAALWGQGLSLTGLVAGGSALSVLYALPKPVRGFRGFKYLPWVKAPFVGTLVTGATTLLGAWFHEQPIFARTWLMLSVFCATTANVIATDTLDVETDRRNAVPSLAVAHTRSFVDRILVALAVIGVATALADGLWAHTLLTPSLVALHLAPWALEPRARAATYDATLFVPAIAILTARAIFGPDP